MSRGYWITPEAIPDSLRRELVNDARRYVFTPPNRRGGGAFAKSILTNRGSASPAGALAKWLRGGTHGADSLAAFVPNEASYQSYERGRQGLPPHRDQRYYVNAIAIVTLEGRARFAVLGSADPRDVLDEWFTEPGQVVILAGWNMSSAADVRPYHQVDAPTTSNRLMLQLRQNALLDGAHSLDLTSQEIEQALTLAKIPEARRR